MPDSPSLDTRTRLTVMDIPPRQPQGAMVSASAREEQPETSESYVDSSSQEGPPPNRSQVVSAARNGVQAPKDRFTSGETDELKAAGVPESELSECTPPEIETYRIARQLGVTPEQFNHMDPITQLQLTVALRLTTSEQLAKMSPQQKKAWVNSVLLPSCQQVLAAQHSVNMSILHNSR